MILDVSAIEVAFFSQLATAAAGAAVRTALGAGATSIISAERLRIPLPARPFLAWRSGVISGDSNTMRFIYGAWWIYDDTPQGYARINKLISLIEAAYPLNALSFGEVSVFQVGQATEDTVLGLLTRQMQLVYRRLT